MNFSYIAGFFDGEGHISASHTQWKNHQGIRRVPTIVISQKLKEPLLAIQEYLTKYYIRSKIYGRGGKYPIYQLMILGKYSALKFLLFMKNLVIVKKEKIIHWLPLIQESIRIEQDRIKFDKMYYDLYKSGMKYSDIVRKTKRNPTWLTRIIRQGKLGKLD